MIFGHFKILESFWEVLPEGEILTTVYFSDPFFNLEFQESTVSHNLESRTVPLDDVFFPSTLVCNMNNVRRSFIVEVIQDPQVKANPIKLFCSTISMGSINIIKLLHCPLSRQRGGVDKNERKKSSGMPRIEPWGTG